MKIRYRLKKIVQSHKSLKPEHNQLESKYSSYEI